VVEVLNNLPTTPEVRIIPPTAVTTSTLTVDLVTSSTDVESPGLQYHYRWYKDGVLEPNATGESLSSFFTTKGQNWSVEVSAFDGEDEGAPALAWRVIGNAPPAPKTDLPDPEFDEDTTDDLWINLVNAFEDPDGDPLTWSVTGQLGNMEVTIDAVSGQVTFEPAPDWFGNAFVTFIASDGEFSAEQSVTVMVLSVNDIPTFATVNGEPVTGETVEFTIGQGEELVIHYTVADPEGDEVIASVTSSAVVHDEEAGTITFTLRIYDVESPDVKVSLDFLVVVEDRNDPMDDPRITSPTWGEAFKVNQSFTIIAICTDPDVPFGQVLNYTWESNISGLLGHGSSTTLRIAEPGTHLITLTVRDPDYSKTDTIEIVILPPEKVTPPPPPDPDGEEDNFNWVPWATLISALVIVGAILFVVIGKRRTEDFEEEMEEEMRAEEKREALQRTRDAIRDVADEWEAERDGTAEDVAKELKEIKMAIPATPLSVEAKVTEETDEDIAKLWEVMPEEDEGSVADKEALRLEDLKRKYQNAIGRLPYGIPSKALADMEWVDLANALAIGERKKTKDGREVTRIDGRWYYSDHEDTGTFLKEHGARPEAQKGPPAAPVTGREAQLAALGEQLILGEISEESYKELKDKIEKG
jgi:hypothetical protein